MKRTLSILVGLSWALSAPLVLGCRPAPAIDAEPPPAQETPLDPAWLAVDVPAEDELACTGLAQPAGVAASVVPTRCDADVRDVAPHVELTVPAADPAVKRAPDPDARAWRDAPSMHVEGGDPRCDVRHLGEYVRVECRGTWSNLTEALGGDLREVRFAHHDPTWEEHTGRLQDDGVQRLVFPLRPGDRRVFQIGSIHGGWREAWSGSTDVVISALWLDGAYAPEIVISS